MPVSSASSPSAASRPSPASASSSSSNSRPATPGQAAETSSSSSNRPTTQPQGPNSISKVPTAKENEKAAREDLGAALGQLEGEDADSVQLFADVSQNLDQLPREQRKRAIEALSPELSPAQVDQVASEIKDPKTGPMVQDQLFADAVNQYAADNANAQVAVQDGDTTWDLLQSVGGWTPEEIKANGLEKSVGQLNGLNPARLQVGQDVLIPRQDMYQLFDASQDYLNANGMLIQQTDKQHENYRSQFGRPPAGQLLDLVA